MNFLARLVVVREPLPAIFSSLLTRLLRRITPAAGNRSISFRDLRDPMALECADGRNVVLERIGFAH